MLLNVVYGDLTSCHYFWAGGISSGVATRVSNSRQNFKTRFRAAEKKTGKPVFFSGFEMNAILTDKNSISL